MTQKHPVTIQEMDRIAKTIGLATGYNDRAMKRTCLLVRLGCEPTAELYQHELSISERHPADVAHEIESHIDAELGYLPATNTNKNLQWQGVEFDIPAIVERTQATSAELKAQIDERAAVVKSLNSQAANNVRLGVKR